MNTEQPIQNIFYIHLGTIYMKLVALLFLSHILAACYLTQIYSCLFCIQLHLTLLALIYSGKFHAEQITVRLPMLNRPQIHINLF